MTANLLGHTGLRIRFLRTQIPLTQQELVNQINDIMKERHIEGRAISRSYFSAVEREGRVPSGNFIALCAEILGTSTDFLLMRTDDPAPPGSSTIVKSEPEYFSEEADKVAKIVDNSLPIVRQVLVSVAEEIARLNPRISESETTQMMHLIETIAARGDSAALDDLRGFLGVLMSETQEEARRR